MGTDKVIYYTGCIANYSATHIGKAAIHVLEINGFEVILPEQKCCGMSMASVGRVRAARRNAAFNVHSLGKFPHDIITTCPTCALALKQEYVQWLGNSQAEMVSKKTYDILEYLHLMHKQHKLNTDFQPCPESVLYHIPCHMKATGDEDLIESRIQLLKLILGLSVRKIERGCCGMGGTHGLKSRFHEISLQIGSSIFEEIRDAKPDYVLTDCAGCAMQIEFGSGHNVEHPIVLLSRAYAKGSPSLTT